MKRLTHGEAFFIVVMINLINASLVFFELNNGGIWTITLLTSAIGIIITIMVIIKIRKNYHRKKHAEKD